MQFIYLSNSDYKQYYDHEANGTNSKFYFLFYLTTKRINSKVISAFRKVFYFS